jgi:hypothetical protein
MESVSIDRYRRYLNTNDIAQYNGDAAAYLDLIEDVSLNALALGLGRQDIQYEPDSFPAIRYDLNSDITTPTQKEYCATVLLFANGLLVTTDAPDTDKATDALLTVGDRFESIGVFDVDLDQLNWAVDSLLNKRTVSQQNETTYDIYPDANDESVTFEYHVMDVQQGARMQITLTGPSPTPNALKDAMLRDLGYLLPEPVEVFE